MYADVRFDDAATQVFPAQVQSRYVSYGRGARYHLVLGPWGPVSGTTNAAIPRATCDALNPGDTACVSLHPGALGMEWRRAGLCPPG